MAIYIANTVIKLMAQHDHPIKNADVVISGVTFKENCPDIRNSKVIDVVRELKSFGTNVDIYDPEASSDELHHEYGFSLIPTPQ